MFLQSRRFFITLLLSAPILTGCSIQNSLSHAGKVPQHIRFATYFDIGERSLWQLPASARVEVLPNTHTPQTWIDAANSGVQQVFPAPATHNQYRCYIQVQWPAAGNAETDQPAAAWSFQRHLSTMAQIPKIASSHTLKVHLLDAQGSVIQQIDLQIKPKLWGANWSTSQMITNAFIHLAERLRAS